MHFKIESIFMQKMSDTVDSIIDGVGKLDIAEHKIRAPPDVISGKDITKEYRGKNFGQIAGGAGSMGPEKFQRKMIEKGTGIECKKCTGVRINSKTGFFGKKVNPLRDVDGFDYSEDFDGLQAIGDRKLYFNLKCVAGDGGSQTRTLREVGHFIEQQIAILPTHDKTYFANIIDGDVAHKHMDKYAHLVARSPIKEQDKRRIYIGDLLGFFDWYHITISDQ